MSEINLGHIPNTAVIFIILGLACVIFIANSEKFKYAIARHLNFVFGGIFICIGITVAAITPRPIFYISNNHKLIGAVIDGTLQFNKSKDSSNYFAFDTWKQYNGEIPEGHVIIFLDGNKQNCDIENLACVPFNYLGYLAGNFQRSESPLVTKAQIT